MFWYVCILAACLLKCHPVCSSVSVLIGLLYVVSRLGDRRICTPPPPPPLHSQGPDATGRFSNGLHPQRSRGESWRTDRFQVAETLSHHCNQLLDTFGIKMLVSFFLNSFLNASNVEWLLEHMASNEAQQVLCTKNGTAFSLVSVLFSSPSSHWNTWCI